MENFRNPVRNPDSKYVITRLLPSDGRSLRLPQVYRVTKKDEFGIKINTNPGSVNEYVAAIKSLPQET